MKKYIKASFDNPVPEYLKNDKRALEALNHLGIDLKSMVITDTPTGRGKDYPIYIIQEGNYKPFVWIPGVYNDDQHLRNPATRNYESIKYIPKKYLNILDVKYLSKADYKKGFRAHYKDPRYIYDRDGVGQYAGQYQEKKSWDSDELVWSKAGKRPRYGTRRDKSGYSIPDPKIKLQEFYAYGHKGAERIANRLERVYNMLTDLKARLFEVDFTNFGVDRNGKPDYSSTAYQNMLSRFGDACRDYRIALNYASKFKGKSELDSFNISYALDYIKTAEQRAKDVENTLIKQRDW